MLTLMRFLQVLALALWLGGTVFLSFFVAPAAFAVLPTRQLAGDLVGQLLPRLYLLSYACAVVYLLALLFEQRLVSGSLRGLVLPVALVVVMLFLLLFNHLYLGERMANLRAEMTAAFGSIDQTPREYALRLRFNRYHGVSSLLLTADLLLLVGLLALTVRRLH
ncbi:MAG: DUF4149 domain-containing protein [Terriglobia bacterium]